jgi:HEAT repeat protein
MMHRDRNKDRARKGFLEALPGGTLSEAALVAALDEHDFTLDEVAWCLFEKARATRNFGLYAVARGSQRDKGKALFKLLAKEPAGPRRLAVIQAIAMVRDGQCLAELGKLANSRLVEERRLAQQVLVRLEGWTELRSLVTAFLDDPEAEVVLDTLRHLLEARTGQYLGALRHLAIHPDERVRRVVLEWMIGQRDPSFAETFFARLPREDGALAEVIRGALIGLTDAHPDAMLEWCVQGLADAAEPVRRLSLELFVRLLGREGALRRLMSYTASVTDWVRDTIYAGARGHAAAFVEPVRAYLESEHNDKLRFQALHFAHALQEPRLLPTLLDAWERGDWVSRYQILLVLSESPSPQARVVLREALQAKETRLLAVRALRRYQDDAVLGELVAVLGEADPTTQMEILGALQERGEARTVQYLARLVGERGCDPLVRAKGIEVIEAMCGRLGVPVPRKVVASGKEERERRLEGLPDLGLRLVAE